MATTTPMSKVITFPLSPVDVARDGQKQFPGQSALPKARTHASSALCRRPGYERVLLARGTRKPVDPLPSACSYMRFACGSGIRIGVRQRYVDDRLLASAEVSMEAPCTERARNETACRTTNPEVKRDYACDHSRSPARTPFDVIANDINL